MSMKLYVGNLAPQITNEQLGNLFEQAGSVDFGLVESDYVSGRSYGYGYVTMASAREGLAAIMLFNGKEVNGRVLDVSEAEPPLTLAAGTGSGTRKENSYAASRAIRWQRS